MPTPLTLRSLYFPAILLLVIAAVGGSPINGSESRKLDETDESKCGGCPCSNPCTTPSNPPPPPPSVYCPPPPAPVKPPPTTKYCPPPPFPLSPPSGIIYITGPPGNLYPVDQTYGDAGRRSSVLALPAVVLALLMLW